MKKTITAIIILLISLNLNAQSKDSIPINDSVPILSIKDVSDYVNDLKDKITYNQFQLILSVMQDMVNKKQKELQQPKKK